MATATLPERSRASAEESGVGAESDESAAQARIDALAQRVHDVVAGRTIDTGELGLEGFERSRVKAGDFLSELFVQSAAQRSAMAGLARQRHHRQLETLAVDLMRRSHLLETELKRRVTRARVEQNDDLKSDLQRSTSRLLTARRELANEAGFRAHPSTEDKRRELPPNMGRLVVGMIVIALLSGYIIWQRFAG